MGDKIIQIQNLGKTFEAKGTKVTALKDINLDIEKGEIFGIIGLSGAGKSTLIRCLNHLEVPTTGAVLVDGKNLNGLKNKELLQVRKGMGMIFQQFNLLMQKNVLDNIAYPLLIDGWNKKKARERAKELLKIVSLEDKGKAFPAQLSGGQKQRVAIARALANDPKVLLCDEATSALDPETTRSVLDLLRRINKEMGITIVIVTHEMDVIEQICNRVAIIDHNHIVEMDEVQKVFANPKTDIAKRLIGVEGIQSTGNEDHFQKMQKEHVDGEKLRIVFDGQAANEPVIANLVLECKTAVNILFADTREMDQKAVGQMILQIPKEQVQQAVTYLSERGLTVERLQEGGSQNV